MADQPDPAAMQAAYGKIIAKAWTDEAFKQRLLSDPATVLKEEGVDVPAGVTVKVVENSPGIVHLVIPPRPPESELSDEDLDRVAAGSAHSDFRCQFSIATDIWNFCLSHTSRTCA